ncbi:MAG: exopolyphosphatase [Rhodospirillaceae bacterium]|nr:exopolyphosphatase [Rhodospirillaceae bacterium]
MGILDIGSNSIRLVVYEDSARVPLPLFNEKVLCGLGSEIRQTGSLSELGCSLAVANIARFTELARQMQLSSLEVIATAALRDASNGTAFVRKLKHQFGFPIKILSGQAEAKLSALGVISAFPKLDGIVADLGGGSLELINVSEGRIRNQISLPLGVLRFGSLTKTSRLEIQKTINENLLNLPWLPCFKEKSLFAVGGAWRNLARMHMHSIYYPLHIIHGYRMIGAPAITFLNAISDSNITQLEKMRGVSKKRIKGVPVSALILKTMLELGENKNIIFSAFGLREGCVYDRLSVEEQKQDPLIISCKKIASNSQRFTLTDSELEGWVLPLFTQIDLDDKRLLKAICILSDFAWVNHPSYRGEQAFLKVLRIPSVGLTHEDRVFMALAVLARYNGNINIPVAEHWRSTISTQRADLAVKIGVVIRLGLTLCAGLDGILKKIQLSKSQDGIEITYPPELESINGYAISRRIEQLEKTFYCPVILRALDL